MSARPAMQLKALKVSLVPICLDKSVIAVASLPLMFSYALHHVSNGSRRSGTSARH